MHSGLDHHISTRHVIRPRYSEDRIDGDAYAIRWTEHEIQHLLTMPLDLGVHAVQTSHHTVALTKIGGRHLAHQALLSYHDDQQKEPDTIHHG